MILLEWFRGSGLGGAALPEVVLEGLEGLGDLGVGAHRERGVHRLGAEEDVIRRFHRSVGNFWRTYRKAASGWHLVCNAERRFVEVARGFAEECEIFDEGLYKDFLDLEGVNDAKRTV